MEHSEFEANIQEALAELNKSQEKRQQNSPLNDPERMSGAIANSLEELRISLEELDQQNAELIESRIELENQYQKYKNLFSLARDAYIVTDRHGAIKEINQSAASWLEVSFQHIKGKPLNVFLAEYRHREFHSWLEQIVTAGGMQNCKVYLKPRHSEAFVAEVCTTLEKNYRGEIESILWAVRDCGDRQQEQQTDILAVLPDAITTINLEGRITFCNPSAAKLYGWQLTGVLNRTLSEIWAEGDLQQLATARETVLQNGSWQGQFERLSQTGDKQIIASRWTLLRDRQKNPMGIVIVDTDITQTQQLAAKSDYSERLKTFASVTRQLAHDLNNVLNPILGATYLLSVADDLKASSLDLVEAIETSAKQGSALANQIATFARFKELKLETLQIEKILHKVRRIIKEYYSEAIAIEVELADELPPIAADAKQIEQAVLNIALNACNAMPNGGTLVLKTERRILDENQVRQHSDVCVGEHLVISAIDTGMGIPPQFGDRVFEPFFTTKNSGSTGLGLFVALGIIKSHGGFIEVTSEVGEGTQLAIFLPLTENQATNS